VSNKYSGKEITLLLIASAEKEGLTPVKLQKAVFILQKAFPKYFTNIYHFSPYNYGPFDIDIYHDADKLVREELVEKKMVSTNFQRYVISLEGEETAPFVAKKLPKEVNDYIPRLMTWILPLTFEKLVSAIYKKYPEYKKNSVFKD